MTRLLILAFCLLSVNCLSQNMPSGTRGTVARSGQTFNSTAAYIENIGQYGKILPGFEGMGEILYAYEGLDMPVLFTKRGMIHLQRSIRKLRHKEEERLEKQGLSEAEIERQRNIKERIISMEWLGANPDAVMEATEKNTDYHTYGFLTRKAAGYKKIVYKNLYPGIDLVYSFTNVAGSAAGFEYSFIAAPGADISNIRLRVDGDFKKIKSDKSGKLIIASAINGIVFNMPVSYYGDQLKTPVTNALAFTYDINKNIIGFHPPANYDPSKPVVIDPFVTATNTLNGVNAGKAKDVDFDYAGNIYVTGGGDGNIYKLAKYDASGTLLWTFNGSITIPAWTFGQYYGGWVVDKSNGSVYMGQGFSPATGYRVLRISTTGLYDNYISNGNFNFNENWKMYWSCNNGSPQILVVGGGTSSNLNLGILTPPALNITPLNITGIPGSVCQDMVDMVFDPANFDIYTLFASTFMTPVLNDKIYKNTAPYSAATIAWNVPSGYTVVSEAANRPYLANVFAPYNDNSANVLALNGSYLYYWDGKSLKAFNKATGAGVGTPLTTANTSMMQGGIVVDACNNIFVGEANGVIKVYKFNGSVFDDAAAADISIPGYNGKAVYDLAYDEARRLMYASGDGFLASFDISSYCPSTSFTINVTPDCANGTASATLVPAPPSGSVVTYVLFNGATQLASNNTGIFNGLLPGISYTIVATVNLACSGTQVSTSFSMPGPIVGETHTNTTCGANTGSITASASGGTAPYTYSIDGVNYQSAALFTVLAAGVYTLTARDLNGCRNSLTVIIQNSNGPLLSCSSTNADCGGNNGTITATVTGGTTPYQYTINGTSYQTNNFFTGLSGGTYTLTVKDAANCSNSVIVTINSSPAPLLTAIPGTATCGNNNGTITAFGSAGTPPLEYSINGNIYQPGTVFTNLSPGTYTVYVRDFNHCIATTTVTVGDSPAPGLTLAVTGATCNNTNGVITATATGGLAPLQYNINGGAYQSGNIFTGLVPGNYIITVKDGGGCVSTAQTTVNSTNAPTVSATSGASACSSNTGSIVIAASGGQPGYTYSINNSTYQAGNTFTGLAAGTYVAYAKDAGGCIGTFTIVVGNTTGPSIAVSTTPTSCNANDGVITITGSGGTPGYTYSINGSTYFASNVFSGLASGPYTAYVKDANGCVKSASVLVANAAGLLVSVSSIVSSCNTNNGVITIVASGGAAPLQYSINGVTYQAGNVFGGLAAGSYTAYVKDNNGCIVTRAVVVGTVSGPSLNLVTQNGTCGTASGAIIATGSGGLAPLTYNIDGGAYQLHGYFINLSAATHTVTVKDATGCITSQNATLTSPGSGSAPTDVTFTIKDVLACTGGVGKIKNLKGVPSGGGNTYTFSLDFGAFTTSNQFTNVPLGVHVVTAKNQNGCTISKLATLGSGTPATATATATPTTCGSSTGTITVVGVGANTPYHVSIDNGSTWVTFFPPGANSFTFTNLAAGTYPIIIADDADFTTGPPDIPGACLTTIYVAVPSSGGPSISTTQINPSCSGNNGSITAAGTGGTGPYTYNIDGGPYFSSGVFNNLAGGVHAVTVKDQTGCITGTNVTLTATVGPALSVTVTPVSCNAANGIISATATGGAAPLLYSIDGNIFHNSGTFSNLTPGSYTVYVKDINQCYSTQTVTVGNTSLPLATAFTVAATCNNNDGSVTATGTGGSTPYTFSIDGSIYQSANTFTGLAAGFYTVYIKDARDCITTTGVAVGNASGPSITAATGVSATCGNANGSISVSASGGSGALEYSIDGTTFQSGNVFSSLLPGTYVITVRDGSGCLSTRPVVVGNAAGPQTLNAVVVNAACGLGNGSITASASGGTGALQYSINGTTYQAGTLFTGLAGGTYTLYVKDANGCIKTTAVTVLNLAGPSLTALATDASCGLNDGTITAIASGGTGILSYSKDGIIFQASNIFINLAPNVYTITVRDERGCTATTTVQVNVSTIIFTGSLSALTGGSQVCKSGAVLPGGTSYFDGSCNLIDKVVPTGAVPVSGTVQNCVIIDATVQTFNNEPYVQRHFDIEPSVNANTATATVTLYFRDQEFAEFNLHRSGFPPLPTVATGGNTDPARSNLRVTQYHGVPVAPHNAGNPAPGFYSVNGGSGVLITPTSVLYNTTYDYWEVSFPVTGFSGFYVHTNLYLPLAVSLKNFTGKRQDGKHFLNWELDCNNTSGVKFELERSADGVSFSTLYSNQVNAVQCLQPFGYTDSQPLAGLNYYRLKITMADGKQLYSAVVTLLNASKEMEIVNIVPNPVTDGNCIITISSNRNMAASLQITDLQGRRIRKEAVQLQSGRNSLPVNVSELAGGTYTIMVSSADEKSRVMRFVKQ